VFGDIIDWIEELGLVAVFFLAVLDSMGLPATGDAALIGWAATSDRPLLLIGAVAFAGAVVGDHIAYWVGRSGGSRLVRRFLQPEKERKLAERMHRHAPLVLVFGRMVAAIRTKAAVLSGSARLDYRRFAVWNLLGCALWATTYAILGRVVGERVLEFLDSAERVVLALVGVAVVLVVVWYVRRRLASRHATPGVPPAPTVPDPE
jgi:membrane protein DedA with SNARE-associated domain